MKKLLLIPALCMFSFVFGQTEKIFSLVSEDTLSYTPDPKNPTKKIIGVRGENDFRYLSRVTATYSFGAGFYGGFVYQRTMGLLNAEYRITSFGFTVGADHKFFKKFSLGGGIMGNASTTGDFIYRTWFLVFYANANYTLLEDKKWLLKGYLMPQTLYHAKPESRHQGLENNNDGANQFVSFGLNLNYKM